MNCSSDLSFHSKKTNSNIVIPPTSQNMIQLPMEDFPYPSRQTHTTTFKKKKKKVEAQLALSSVQKTKQRGREDNPS
jgi:hypothetical protein